MHRMRILIPLLALCALVVGVAPTAASEPLPSGVPEVGLATPAEEALLQQQLAEALPVIATYNGKKIDLADGWQGAQACSEVATGEVYCYDSAEEADQVLASIAPAAGGTPEGGAASAKGSGDFGPTAIGDCLYRWVCLWEHSNFTGRRLQWQAGGTKQLSTWDFRDKASAACVNRDQGGLLAYDARTAQPDPYMALGVGYCYKFTDSSYPYGGTFNDKVDYIKM